MNDMSNFHQEFMADIKGDADALGLITAEAFLEKTGEILEEAGELTSLDRCYYEGRNGVKAIQVDAYSWDPKDEEGVFSLVLCDFVQGDDPQSIAKKEIDALLNRLAQFTVAARDQNFRERLEETSSAFALADLLVRSWRMINKFKLIIVTNRLNVARTDAIEIGKLGGVPVTSNVWDLARIRRYITSGQTREDLVVDFAGDFDEAVPVLKASMDGAAYDSYIAVLPGRQLAAIYDKWGARLLEANVRSFLQARNKVNKGIRDTIRDDPSMFFSYNNGLTATAEAVEVVDTGEGLMLMSADNFQIVNGGQTSASIHAARKLAPEQLKSVFVQMKLTVVPKDRAEEVVPRISEYANSQNKVNAADFFANHPFHIRIEEFSRRIWAPAGDTHYRETKWFYERARGQYADERGRRTEAQRKKFDAEFPSNQFFTKTDLAKFENSYRCKPHIVSLGAQKNFGELARVIGEEWGKSEAAFDEVWYKRLIAKALIFRNLERLVPAQPWYEPGYRANIVTYAFAKIAHDAEARKRVIDLDQVWRLQRVPVVLERASLAAAEAAKQVITNAPPTVRNISEWAKKQACWTEVSKLVIPYEKEFFGTLLDPEDARSYKREQRLEREAISGIEAQTEVVSLGGDYWGTVLAFGRSIGKLSPTEASILEFCSHVPRKVPSEKQALAALKIVDRLEKFY